MGKQDTVPSPSSEIERMSPRERADYLRSFMEPAMQIVAMCPEGLVDAVLADARRWDVLGPIVDPTTYMRVTGSESERIGTIGLKGFVALYRAIEDIRAITEPQRPVGEGCDRGA